MLPPMNPVESSKKGGNMDMPHHSCQDDEGNDGPPLTLRQTLISIEQSGLVDFEIAGHSCKRPPSACQGADEIDRFLGRRCLNN